MPGLGDRLRGLFGKAEHQASAQVNTAKDDGMLGDTKDKVGGFVNRAKDKVDDVADDVVDEVKDRTKD